MRVLHVTPSFSPCIGGIEKVVHQLALGLATRGVETAVAHVAPNLRYGREQLGTLAVWRVPLIGHRLFGLSPALRGIMHGYDLLHVHDPQLMALTFNAAVAGGSKPLVLSTHGGYYHTSRHRAFKALHERFLLRSMLSTYDRVLATSLADQAHFSRFSAAVDLAENGVETVRFAKIHGENRSFRQWIYWGRLSRNKRLDRAIDLARLAVDAGENVDFLITGPDFDDLTGSLKAHIASRGLEKHVQVKPALDDVELDRELATRGVYVTASEHEGFGLGVVEALAAGLLILCRDIAPLNGFVSDRSNGFFLAFDGSERDRRALVELLSATPDQQRMMSLGARRAAERYSWEAAVARFAAIYADVLASRSLTGSTA